MTGAIITTIAGACLFLLGFRIYWKRNIGKFVEFKPSQGEHLVYSLKASNWFYKGLPPTIDQSAFHAPQIQIKPCMLLKFLGTCYSGYDYLVFEVKTNECSDKEQKLNGTTVYYKKDLFDNLDKKEIK